MSTMTNLTQERMAKLIRSVHIDTSDVLLYVSGIIPYNGFNIPEQENKSVYAAVLYN